MAGKVCPVLSDKSDLYNCIGTDCMLFLESSSTGACGLVKAPLQLSSKLDTLSAQVQEMQVALIKLTNA